MKAKGIMCVAVLCAAAGGASAGEKAPQAIVDHVKSVVVGWQADPAIVAAVKAQNARGQSLEEIQALDRKWQATPGVADFMKALMDSPCGQRLRQLQSSRGFYAEIFVTDDQGANVCMSDKTSDYWQGDEDKFKKTFVGPGGQIFIDDVRFDASSQGYTVQASLPVLDGQRAIGVLTVGIDVDAFEKGK